MQYQVELDQVHQISRPRPSLQPINTSNVSEFTSITRPPMLRSFSSASTLVSTDQSGGSLSRLPSPSLGSRVLSQSESRQPIISGPTQTQPSRWSFFRAFRSQSWIPWRGEELHTATRPEIGHPQMDPDVQARLTRTYVLDRPSRIPVSRQRIQSSSTISSFVPMARLDEQNELRNLDLESKGIPITLTPISPRSERPFQSPVSPRTESIHKGRRGRRASEMTVFNLHPGARMKM